MGSMFGRTKNGEKLPLLMEEEYGLIVFNNRELFKSITKSYGTVNVNYRYDGTGSLLETRVVKYKSKHIKITHVACYDDLDYFAGFQYRTETGNPIPILVSYDKYDNLSVDSADEMVKNYRNVVLIHIGNEEGKIISDPLSCLCNYNKSTFNDILNDMTGLRSYTR